MESTFCPSCLEVSECSVVVRQETFSVRGEDVTVDAHVAVCGTCGEDIGIAELDDATLRSAYAVYRARHDLLQPEQIKAIRSMYGLGQKAFARLLGWGDVTLARYETGSLQSDAHDATLRLAENPDNVRQMLRRHGGRLSDEQRATVEARLNEISGPHESLLVHEEMAGYGADPAVRKLCEMMVYFAERPKLWRTKLNKLLFYSDFLHFKRHGAPISGARYMHMQYGPVPSDFYALQAALVDGASLDEVPVEQGDCSGTLFVARRPADRSLFSASELETMAYVADYFKNWTAARVMEFSHSEPGWAETRDRETIPLSYAMRLQLK